ncbi:MAG TPA: hypothetical protein VF263_23030, partial [Longimicrobiaceae bacterium]
MKVYTITHRKDGQTKTYRVKVEKDKKRIDMESLNVATTDTDCPPDAFTCSRTYGEEVISGETVVNINTGEQVDPAAFPEYADAVAGPYHCPSR